MFQVALRKKRRIWIILYIHRRCWQLPIFSRKSLHNVAWLSLSFTLASFSCFLFPRGNLFGTFLRLGRSVGEKKKASFLLSAVGHFDFRDYCLGLSEKGADLRMISEARATTFWLLCFWKPLPTRNRKLRESFEIGLSNWNVKRRKAII